MQSVEAGSAMFAPMMIFVAAASSVAAQGNALKTLTDIAPYWVLDHRAARPYNGVDPADDVEEAEPGDNRESGNIAGLPVPRQWYKYENGADKRDDGQLDPHGGRKGRGEDSWIEKPRGPSTC